MKRRAFLAALAGLPFLPSALSALPAPVGFGNRFIGAGFYDPQTHAYWIPQRKIMARICITQEALHDVGYRGGAFVKAMALEHSTLLHDLEHRELAGTRY